MQYVVGHTPKSPMGHAVTQPSTSDLQGEGEGFLPLWLILIKLFNQMAMEIWNQTYYGKIRAEYPKIIILCREQESFKYGETSPSLPLSSSNEYFAQCSTGFFFLPGHEKMTITAKWIEVVVLKVNFHWILALSSDKKRFISILWFLELEYLDLAYPL